MNITNIFFTLAVLSVPISMFLGASWTSSAVLFSSLMVAGAIWQEGDK